MVSDRYFITCGPFYSGPSDSPQSSIFYGTYILVTLSAPVERLLNVPYSSHVQPTCSSIGSERHNPWGFSRVQERRKRSTRSGSPLPEHVPSARRQDPERRDARSPLPEPAPLRPLQDSEYRAARSPSPEPAPSAQRQAAERRVARWAGALQQSGAVAALRLRPSPSHPSSSASRSLPRLPCAASRDCCREPIGDRRYPAPARLSRQEARRRPCLPPPTSAGAGNRPARGSGREWGRPGARGVLRKGREDWGGAGRPRSFEIELPSRGRAVPEGAPVRGVGGQSSEQMSGCMAWGGGGEGSRGIGQRGSPEVLPRGFGESAHPRCA